MKKNLNGFFFEDSDIEDFVNDGDDDDLEDEFTKKNDKLEILKLRLCTLILRHHMSNRLVEDLLFSLREFGLELPKKKSTLLKVNSLQESLPIIHRDCTDGKYIHFGIENSLQKCSYDFLENPAYNPVSIDINIDGLPLYTSSRKSLWTILGAFVDQKTVPPFCIGVWEGVGHPKSWDDFLKNLADELIILQTKTIRVGKNKIEKNFHLRSIICDAPAKAFVKNVLNHNAKCGCNECNQVGFRIKNTPVYQIQSGNLRTDIDFQNRSDICHHHSPNQTELERASLKMVSQFPLDPMHLVDLGVAKRILTYILDILPKSSHPDISNSLVSIGSYIPREFARKPRGVSEIARWEATEFRMFIYYTGIVILKKFIPDSHYYHLLLLTTALRLMSDEAYCKYNIAPIQILINEFVQIFSQLYGLKHINYNVHSLLHLPNYVQMYGPLESFSGYKFENFLQEIKKNVKCSSNILTQIKNRVCERWYLNSQFHNLSITEGKGISHGCTKFNSYTYNSHTFKLN